MILEQKPRAVPPHPPVRDVTREVLRTQAQALRWWCQVCLSFVSLVGILCPVITSWVTQCRPAAAFDFLLCQVIQDLSTLLMFGADDPSPKPGPGLWATLEK